MTQAYYGQWKLFCFSASVCLQMLQKWVLRMHSIKTAMRKHSTDTSELALEILLSGRSLYSLYSVRLLIFIGILGVMPLE